MFETRPLQIIVWQLMHCSIKIAVFLRKCSNINFVFRGWFSKNKVIFAKLLTNNIYFVLNVFSYFVVIPILIPNRKVDILLRAK